MAASEEVSKLSLVSPEVLSEREVNVDDLKPDVTLETPDSPSVTDDLSVPCLVCNQPYHTAVEFFDFDDELLVAQNAEIFETVCSKLKITFNGEDQQWDFKKELLPFCSTCCEISEDVVRLDKELKRLEEELNTKIDTLKNLILESSGVDVAKLKIKHKQSIVTERFCNFRSKILDTRQHQALKVEPPKNEPVEEALPQRKSTRLRNSTLDYKELFDDDVDSDDQTRYPKRRRNSTGGLKSDSTDSTYTCNTTDAESNEAFDPSIIKTEPLDSDDYYDPCDDDLDYEEIEMLKPRKTRKSSKTNQIDPTIPKRGRGRPRKIRVTSGDSDTEHESKQKHHTWKWKTDKQTGKMWYDNLEVLVLPEALECSECHEVIPGDKTYNHKSKMKAHIISKHKEKQCFQCVLCEKILSAKKYLDLHIQMVHEKSVTIECDICGKPFTSVNAMRRHRWNHQSEEEKQAALAAGKKQYGGGSRQGKTLQCKKCGKLVKGHYNLKRHEETHIEAKDRPKYMCQICGSLYSAPETLRAHMKLAHNNNNQLQWLQCPECPKKFPQPGRLEKHMRSHTGEKPFLCKECGARFSQPTLLKVHTLKHKNLRPHKCEHCEMAFYRRYHLQRHTEVYHDSDKPPTRKQPYRSENGTRKAPQKRKKHPPTEIRTPEVQHKKFHYDTLQHHPIHQLISESQTSQPRIPSQSSCENEVESHIIGIVDTPQNFSFAASNSCSYPFAYTFGHPSNLHSS